METQPIHRRSSQGFPATHHRHHHVVTKRISRIHADRFPYLRRISRTQRQKDSKQNASRSTERCDAAAARPTARRQPAAEQSASAEVSGLRTNVRLEIVVRHLPDGPYSGLDRAGSSRGSHINYGLGWAVTRRPSRRTRPVVIPL
jgi:hypothetical protein